jgi:hypothetical protein
MDISPTSLDFDLDTISPDDLTGLSSDKFREMGKVILDLYQTDRQENQLRYYQPVSPQACEIHRATETVIGVGGGNGSSKTESCIVELLHLSTGIIPDSLKGTPWREKFKGPRKQRIVVESLTTTLHTIILPKFKWWVWTGLGDPGGPQGHWGWLPKWALVDGSWDKSWSEKLRLLRFLCRDPENPDQVLGESTIQFMAHGQEPQDFASGEFDEVLHDEPPRMAIWTENEARTMRAKGRMLLAMTWPDDPAIPVDWIHDRLYSPGRGAAKRKDTVWIELSSFDNPHLDLGSLRAQADRWDATMRAVRFEGKPIRFSNRVHPLFTEQDAWWCFSCKKDAFVRIEAERYVCTDCGGTGVQIYNHVASFDVEPTWPTVFLLDPHPRKPHMMIWAQCSPQDDLWVQKELEHEGGCEDVAARVLALEEEYGFQVAQRWIDPNMGASPANAQRREQTWQDEFSDVGLRCDLADDFMGGRKRINTYLEPDPRTYDVRLHIHRDRCSTVVSQMLRYCWQDYKKTLERDQMQKPRDKNDDYPTLLKYLLNSNPEFTTLRMGSPIISRRRVNAEYRQNPKHMRNVRGSRTWA